MNTAQWTETQLLAEALKYTSRKDLQKANSAVYSRILSIKGLRETAFAHMSRPFTGKWTEKKIAEKALEFTTRKDFHANAKGAYAQAQSLGILDTVCAHMEALRVRWTPKSIHQEALKYDNKTAFRAKAYRAYLKANRLSILDTVCAHMEDVQRETNKILPDIPKDMSGVYILYNKNDIVYIGKSNTCMYQRVRAHLKTYAFTSVELFEIANEADIHIAEIYLIAVNQPKLNTDCTSKVKPTLVISNLNDIIKSKIVINVKEQYEKSRIGVSNQG